MSTTTLQISLDPHVTIMTHLIYERWSSTRGDVTLNSYGVFLSCINSLIIVDENCSITVFGWTIEIFTISYLFVSSFMMRYTEPKLFFLGQYLLPFRYHAGLQGTFWLRWSSTTIPRPVLIRSPKRYGKRTLQAGDSTIFRDDNNTHFNIFNLMSFVYASVQL